MALIEFNFESQYLGNNHTVGIIVPDKPRALTPKEFYGGGKKYPVIWLLHGTYGDYSDWIRKSNIELYACENDIMVVMPSAMNSDYSNWTNYGTGYSMWDYMTEELMPLVHSWFPASSKREDNYVAGLSMGGRGTLMLALMHPDKFNAAAALSSPGRSYGFLKKYASMDAYEFKKKVIAKEIAPEENGKAVTMAPRQLNAIAKYDTVGDFLASQENTFDRFEEAVKAKKLIKLYCAMGTKDHLYANYLEFKKHAEALKADVLFEELEGYAHEWRFWDLTIEKAIEFFGLKKKASAGNAY